MRYRPEIDGLRAVAVVPVILFHAGFGAFGGGFVGVDVFFVISGYLITGLIREEMARGAFSLAGFYERRVRRILPALLLVSLACIPFAWFWMLPDEMEAFARSLVAVNLFVSNILFWRESGYFEAALELKPLLHSWSLAVEEQFYLLFPLLLLLFRKMPARTLAAILLLLTAFSLGLAEWGSRAHPDATFYLLPTRAWELGAGALLALASGGWKPAGLLAEALSAAGLALILAAVLAFDERLPFPGLWALIPVLGTVLVIAAAGPATLVGRLLAWRPLVAIGLISYSAYLWHQPLFVFARIRNLDALPTSMALGLSALALVLGALSWRFVEQPFRRRPAVAGRPAARRRIFAGAALASAVMVVLGSLGIATAGLPERFPEAARMAAWSQDLNPRREACYFERPDEMQSADQACLYGDPGDPRIALWGDSHADVLAFELARTLNERHHALKVFAASACAPVLGQRRSDKADGCGDFTALTLEALLRDRKIETVVLAARWTRFFEGEGFDNREGGVEAGAPIYALPPGKGTAFLDDPGRVEAVGQLLRETLRRLLQGGKRVVLVYPIPAAGWDVPHRLAREMILGLARREPLSISSEVFRERVRRSEAQLDRAGDDLDLSRPNLIRIRPAGIFCDRALPGRCVEQQDGQPLYRDDDHLNSLGAALLADRIAEELAAKGWLASSGP